MRNNKVKNNICFVFSLNNSEIVEGKRAVIIIYDLCYDFLVFVYPFIVYGNRVHMNTNHNIQLFADDLFNLIYNLVNFKYVCIAGNLCVHRGNYSAGSVIVNNKVVNTDYALLGKHKLLNAFNELRVGSLSQKISYNILNDFYACKNNDNRNNNSYNSVCIFEACEM